MSNQNDPYANGMLDVEQDPSVLLNQKMGPAPPEATGPNPDTIYKAPGFGTGKAPWDLPSAGNSLPPALPSTLPLPSSSQNTGVTAGFLPGEPNPNPTSATPAAASAPFNYEKARDEWMSGKYGKGEAGARAWAAANGVPYNGGDTITLPNGGGQIDIIGNFGGGKGDPNRMANNWTPAGGNGPNPGGQGNAPPASPTVPGPGTPGAPPPGGDTGSFASHQDPAIHDAIMALLRRGSQPVSAADVAEQYAPASQALQRGAQQTRMAAAQRAAGEGQLEGGAGSGGFDAGVTGINEDLGAQQGQLSAGLIGKELTARRQDVANAIQFAQGEEKTQLSKELADIDAQIRRSQIAQQGQLGNRGLDIQEKGLGQQNQQFYDTYAANLGRDEQTYNALMAGLGNSGG